MPAIYKERDEICAFVKDARASGKKVALVPTMGSLHEGHLSLVWQALNDHDVVVVSLYVNPTQFSEDEDLAAYPRQFDDDYQALAMIEAKAKPAQQICLFAPESLYPDGFATMLHPQGAALPLEGVHRPHFFGGVATAVYQLFQAVPANSAFFGEKDFQQLAVIKQMVRDLALPIAIMNGRTIRADDGLALSSRNAYLTQEERQIAPMLYAQMIACAKACAAGQDAHQSCDGAVALLQNFGFGPVDYFMWCEPDTLAPLSQTGGALAKQSRLMVALWLGKTRLIDNACYELLCSAQ